MLINKKGGENMPKSNTKKGMKHKGKKEIRVEGGTEMGYSSDDTKMGYYSDDTKMGYNSDNTNMSYNSKAKTKRTRSCHY